MLDPRISALEEDLDEVESSEEEDEEEEKVQLSKGKPGIVEVSAGGRRNDDVWFFIHSQNDFRPLNRTDAVTVTTTDLGGLRHRATGAVVRPDGLCFSHICVLL